MPKVPFWIFIFIAIVYFTAVRVDIMDRDATQYAETSREMLNSGDYLHVYNQGKDYLDKPPFLFWSSVAGMKLFGVNNLGYRFFSILFALLAVFSTYKLGKILYGDITGRMAALVLASCQGMFLMTNDIRCDTILMSWVITAIWLIQEWANNRKPLCLMGGFAAIGFGMITKGPIALMVPVFCFTSDWILKRKWNNFLQPAYIPGIIIIALVLLPMSIGLYQQFDMHPEKLIEGKRHVSGLRFFYWSQSFGRITGESPWKNGADISFLLVNMLWSFLPWMFLFIPAVVINITRLVKQKFKLHPGQEWVTTGGFLLAYLVLGSSSYQLPHYIFVVFPLAAIITAKLLYDIIEGKQYPRLSKFIAPFQFVIIALLLLATLVLITYVFPSHPLVIAGWPVGLLICLYLFLRKELIGKFFWLSAAAMIIINIFITNQLYYSLLKYQVGSQVGRYIFTNHILAESIMVYKLDDPRNSMQFYAQKTITGSDSVKDIQGRQYILTSNEGLNDLRQKGYNFDIQKEGASFKVSELTLPFLDPHTRDGELKHYYIVKLK